MKYLVLARYTKSKKTTWWVSTTEWLWKKDRITFMSGTTTQIKIIDVLEITDEQYKLYSTVE